MNTTAPQKVDEALELIAEYAFNPLEVKDETLSTARACLADTLGCGILALNFKDCTKLLGPVIAETVVPNGCHVPGTGYILDPIRAAFNIGTMIRWLDFNDTWLAAEWGHPSDNLGALLATCEYLNRQGEDIKVKDLLVAMIKAHEIQGILALENSFNRIGFDHVILVKVASAAVATALLGGTKEQVINAVSQAWIDAGPLRTYRHAPNTGSRKSWAAGDATSRGLFLSLLTLKGEMGYATALSAENWGFYDVLFNKKAFKFKRAFQTFVMDNVLFKISFPAEFHAQTAVEAAITLHSQVKNRLNDIAKVQIDTHESAVRIIDKKGPLKNPADRDHCLQYMVAIALIFGNLTAEHYEEKTAQDPRIDALREKMHVTENEVFTNEYIDKRSIANTLTIHFKDGTKTDSVTVEYPIGHRNRRKEGLPLLYEKFKSNLLSHYSESQAYTLVRLFENPQQLDALSIVDFIDLWSV